MDNHTVSSWRDLTLMQLGALMKSSVGDRNHRLYREWFVLVDSLACADAARPARRKKKGIPDFKVTSTQALLVYFFTCAAAVHKRCLFPERSPDLETLVPEYGLDLLSQKLYRNRGDFRSLFGSLVPDRAPGIEALCLDPAQADSSLKGVKWVKNTETERAQLCWEQIQRYLEEEDAPTYQTRAEDAFAWLEEKNRHAYRTIDNAESQRLFELRYECGMEEVYPRLLGLLDGWDCSCMRLWQAFQKKGRLRLRELSAVLAPEPKEDGHA